MKWKELMEEVRQSGLPRAELARLINEEESVLADFEHSDDHVMGEIQIRIRILADQYAQIIRFDGAG